MLALLKYKEDIRKVSANVAIKLSSKVLGTRSCQTDLHFDYERVKGTENAKWLQLTGKQSIERFIPVTRKTLLRKMLEDTEMVAMNEMESFQQLATGIDSALYVHHKKKLDSIKSLYNPLSPDRDTLQMKSFSSKQLIEREDAILSSLGELLNEASFYELPHDVMLDAIGEKNFAENVVVSVSPENYSTLRFWVIGMDIAPLDDRPWYVMAEERARSYKQRTSSSLDPLSRYNFKRSFLAQIRSKLWKKIFGESIRRIARYKRVIVAVRRRNDMKLLIKGFKDIPCENLEFLLPDGKIKMGKLDKIRLLLQSSLIVVFIMATTVTNLTEFKLETSLVLALSAVLIFARNAVIYKNMRNKHVLDMSQTLYFKSVASNHALLTLIVDRAEDEVYKSSLLIYAILHRMQRIPNPVKDLSTGLMESELKCVLESWLKDKFSINVNVTMKISLNYLREWKIIDTLEKDGKKIHCAVDLDDAINFLPHLKRPPLFHHADLLNINVERTSGTSELKTTYLDYEGRYDWE